MASSVEAFGFCCGGDEGNPFIDYRDEGGVHKRIEGDEALEMIKAVLAEEGDYGISHNPKFWYGLSARVFEFLVGAEEV